MAVRICSVPNPGSPESMSFLKVDSRKKQLTLYETAGDGPSSSTQRRSSAPAPKTFNFDAVFSQDASQVGEIQVFSSVGTPFVPLKVLSQFHSGLFGTYLSFYLSRAGVCNLRLRSHTQPFHPSIGIEPKW